MPDNRNKNAKLSEKVGDFMDFAVMQYGNLKKMHGMTELSELEIFTYRPLKMLPNVPACMTIKVLPLSEMQKIITERQIEREASLYQFIAEICNLTDGIPGAGRLTVTVPLIAAVNLKNIGKLMTEFRRSLQCIYDKVNMKIAQRTDAAEMFALCEARDDVQIVVSNYQEDNNFYVQFVIDSFWKPANQIFISALRLLQKKMLLQKREFELPSPTILGDPLFLMREYLQKTILRRDDSRSSSSSSEGVTYQFPSIEFVNQLSALHRRCVAAQLVQTLHAIELEHMNIVPHSYMHTALNMAEQIPQLSQQCRVQLSLSNASAQTVVAVTPTCCRSIIYSGFRHCGSAFYMYTRQVEFKYINDGSVPIFFGDIGQNCFHLRTNAPETGLAGYTPAQTRTIDYYPTEMLWSEWNNFDPSDDQKLGMLEFESTSAHEPNAQLGDKKIVLYQSYFDSHYPPLKIRRFAYCDKKKALISLLERSFHISVVMDRLSLLNINFTVFSIQNLDSMTLDEIIDIQTRDCLPGTKKLIEIPVELLSAYTQRIRLTGGRRDSMHTFRDKFICDHEFYCFEHEILKT